ncbi:MAG: hypothetical protein V4726_20720 [Verrucomicrobiota bacterium]
MSRPPAIPGPPAAAAPGLFHGWWPNPIFRRFARSRLRPNALVVWLLITLILAAFLFFGPRTAALYQGHLPTVDAERAPIFFIMGLQAVILFIFGTGTVAGGVTGEADEGTLDYQRLSPLTPLRKVMGYLFGLPIREWLMFALTLPFTAWSLWRGEIAASTWMPVYATLISSAVLYHLTGLVAGTVVKNRRWAFLFSIILIILLYTVIPQAAKFGLVYFKYLTLWPVIDEHFINFLPREAGGMMRFAKSLQEAPDARFFGLNFSEAVFSIFSQAVLSLTFVMILWRRWRKVEAHMLGKVWAVGLFGWMQLLLLGNALPLIDSGDLFPARQFSRRYVGRGVPDPQIGEALAMIGVYGLVTLSLLVVLTLIITPTVDDQVRGLRRARKLGWARVPRVADAASSLGFVAAMAVTGGVGWTIFAQQLIGSHWFTGHHLAVYAGPAFVLILLAAGLVCQAVLEAWGGKAFFLLCVFAGVVPVLMGGVIGMVSGKALTPATWLAGISPASAPFYAATTLLPTGGFMDEFSRTMPRAFWFWQGITVLTAGWLVMRLREFHRARRASVMGMPVPDPKTAPAAAFPVQGG